MVVNELKTTNTEITKIKLKTWDIDNNDDRGESVVVGKLVIHAILS